MARTCRWNRATRSRFTNDFQIPKETADEWMAEINFTLISPLFPLVFIGFHPFSWVCERYNPGFILAWTAFVRPCLPECRARKVNYDNDPCDQRTTRTRFQRQQTPRACDPARRAHRPRQLVVRQNARSGSQRDGLADRRPTATGTNLDARRKPRSEGLASV